MNNQTVDAGSGEETQQRPKPTDVGPLGRRKSQKMKVQRNEGRSALQIIVVTFKKLTIVNN